VTEELPADRNERKLPGMPAIPMVADLKPEASLDRGEIDSESER